MAPCDTQVYPNGEVQVTCVHSQDISSYLKNIMSILAKYCYVINVLDKSILVTRSNTLIQSNDGNL